MKNFDLRHTFYRDDSECIISLRDENGKEAYDATIPNISLEEVKEIEQQLFDLGDLEECVDILKHYGFTVEEFKW